MELSIILVNWNSTAYARECIRSIYEHVTAIQFEVIVVDNASPAADSDTLKDEFGQIALIKSASNLGFAGANNLGFRHASGRSLLFLNPDTLVTDHAIEEMLRSLKSLPDSGILGCKLLNSDLSIQESCIQTFPTVLNQALDADFLRRRWPRSSLWGTSALLSENPAPVPVEVISGACMMASREVFEKVGLFSEDYFMYAEDLDLCFKTVAAGYRNYYIGRAAIIHHGGKSSNPRTATILKWQSILRFFAKHHGELSALRFRVVLSFVAICRIALLSVASLGLKKANPGGYRPLLKWREILKTLLTHSVRTGMPQGGTNSKSPQQLSAL